MGDLRQVFASFEVGARVVLLKFETVGEWNSKCNSTSFVDRRLCKGRVYAYVKVRFQRQRKVREGGEEGGSRDKLPGSGCPEGGQAPPMLDMFLPLSVVTL
jgi:hypothetical protein